MMLYDFESLAKGERAGLMMQSIVPRPIARVVTESANGVTNVAPFSYFTGVSSEPPLVMISIQYQSDGSLKDTLRNIRETGVATICTVTPSDTSKMHSSASRVQESEAELFGIGLEKTLSDYAPRVTTAPTAMMCSLEREVSFDGGANVVVFLRVEHMWVDDSCDMGDLDVVGRRGQGYKQGGQDVSV